MPKLDPDCSRVTDEQRAGLLLSKEGTRQDKLDPGIETVAWGPRRKDPTDIAVLTPSPVPRICRFLKGTKIKSGSSSPSNTLKNQPGATLTFVLSRQVRLKYQEVCFLCTCLPSLRHPGAHQDGTKTPRDRSAADLGKGSTSTQCFTKVDAFILLLKCI